MMPEFQAISIDDEPPPFMGSWSRIYCVVLAYLVLVILTLYIVTGLCSY
jgi:hypothetical protein